MVRYIRNRFKYILERWIQRGALQQLLLMAALIVLVALCGGLLAWVLTDTFSNPAEAIWWAFLRLTDPGYLGDDEGIVLRTISTVVTVLGYVLFMGSLIAIMTQWLNQTLRTLESGLTPISMSDHFLILGWTNRTPSIVRELVLSESRVRRFLQRRGARRLRIVVLAEEVTAELRQELRDLLGKDLKRGQIILRSGSSMRIEHLHRVDFTRAAAIILPGADYDLGGPESMDSRVVKTLMSISKYGQPQEHGNYPVVVAEIFDTYKTPVAEQAYQGQVHILAGDAFISRLIAQNVRHQGLSHVYAELLSHTEGNEVYVRAWPAFTGMPFAGLFEVFPKALLLGVVRPEDKHFRPILNPPATFKLAAEDRLVMIARSYEDAVPAPRSRPATTTAEKEDVREAEMMRHRRILILGWSHKVAALVQEFGSYPSERFEIDVLSMLPVEERDEVMRRVTASPDRVQVRQLAGDYTMHMDLLQVEPAQYDNVIFLGVDWLDSSAESDARTILGYVLLRALLPPETPGPQILIELKDPSNERLFQHRRGEVIISPVILSHMLAHAALRQELTSVFGELFGPSGAEIFFRPVADYEMLDQEVAFLDVQRQAAAHGEIALGVRLSKSEAVGGIHLNPSPKTRWSLKAADKIIVLTRYS